jgi:putative hydroxymethylpyrimidine transport system substrate-binding protein
MMSMRSAGPLDRRQVVRGAAIGAALLVGANRRTAPVVAADKITVALDWFPNANHAGLFLARDRGLFAAAGLQVDLYTPSDPTVVLQTVGAGRDTFGISYQTDVLLARAQGVPVVSVAALVQHPLVCVMSLKSAGITRPGQLAGKTVAYPGIPSQEAFLAAMLESDGQSLADVTLINVEFNLLPALISGQAGAVMGAFRTHETILAEREGYPVNILPVEDWGVPDFYELVLVASDETVAQRPEMVTAFLTAVRDGYLAAIADSEAALQLLVQAFPETDEEVERAGLELLVPLWQDEAELFGTQTEERWSAYASWMAERGLIPAGLDGAAAYRGDLLPTSAATPVSGG